MIDLGNAGCFTELLLALFVPSSLTPPDKELRSASV